ncbi:MAG TPA: arginine--tRNA ligase [Bacteroidales bacterium]|nr:arginine--tRNA ligase [Bacteroidales bacterium]HRZ49376.1 arginine--tRNA ligase [Bacteroidales bacterium]
MITERLKQAAREAVAHHYQTLPDADIIQIQETSAHFRGDFTLVLFPLLKISRKNPFATGQEIGSWLTEHLGMVESTETVNGYLNITLKDQVWSEFLGSLLSDEKFGFRAPDPETPPVLVEFSSPNTNKPLHLGHIRNNLLGYSIAALLEATGNRVLKVNLVNDRGIHICKSMLGWMKFSGGLTPELAGIKGDRFVGDAYVAFDKAYKREIAELEASGMTREEAERRSRLMEEARSLLRLWEENEPEVKKLWHQMNGWVYEGFEVTYKRLGIRFDKTYYESDTYLLGKEIVQAAVNEGRLLRKADGSVWADLTPEGLDEKLLLRSDGTSVYITQDLGTAILRDREFNPERMYYVVGNEQDYHFSVLEKVLKNLGFGCHSKIHHISYGMVELPGGRMKSREGTVVDADDLLEEMKQTAARVAAELGKWAEEELADLGWMFEMIGQGALKYFILKVDPKKNMLFNPDESIDFDGNTGPFIQYTHARIASLLKKGEETGFSVTAEVLTQEQLEGEERSLLRVLHRWPSVLEEAAKMLNPSLVAGFCYEVAREFNQFYHKHSVLGAPSPDIIHRRLAMAQATGTMLRNGMGLLGISLPERM